MVPYLYHWRVITTNKPPSRIVIQPVGGARCNLLTHEWSSPPSSSWAASVAFTIALPNINPVLPWNVNLINQRLNACMVSFDGHGILYVPTPNGSNGHIQWYDSATNIWSRINHWSLPFTFPHDATIHSATVIWGRGNINVNGKNGRGAGSRRFTLCMLLRDRAVYYRGQFDSIHTMITPSPLPSSPSPSSAAAAAVVLWKEVAAPFTGNLTIVL